MNIDYEKEILYKLTKKGQSLTETTLFGFI